MPYILVLTILFSQNLFSTGRACKNIKTTKHIVQCVLENNYFLEAENLGVEEAKASINISQQWPNPELDSDFLIGDKPEFGFELSLLQTIELGGKRSVRKSLAKTKHTIANLNRKLKQEELVKETMLRLYRIRQINFEIEALREVIHTYKDIIEQYKTVGKLDSEREITVTIFELSLAEMQTNKSFLLNEKTENTSKIELSTATKIDFNKVTLPVLRKKWPEVDKKNIGNFKSTQHKLSENKIFLHQAKLNLEKSEAWPDLKIGPKIAFEQPFLEEDDPGVFWGGISFSIGLPIFHQNQASIRLANLGIQKASILKRFETAKLREERNYFLSSYQTNLIDFERKINMRSLKKRHDYFHKNIQKGLVAAPMVIEFHRQFMAFHQKLHEQELRLVKSYWQIKSLQNKILNELTS